MSARAFAAWQVAGSPGPQPASPFWSGLRILLEEHLERHALGPQLIVRSSEVAETIASRGAYRSEIVEANSSSLIQAAYGVWLDAIRDQSSAPARQMALVIQKYVPASAHGHLSNERRVARQHRQWVCETDLANPPLRVGIESFSARARVDGRRPATLREHLRSVALEFLGPERLHLEWVWDGQRLWIVQRDQEVLPAGRVPTNLWRPGLQPLQGHRFALLIPAQQLPEGHFHKADVLRTFAACQLPVAECMALHHADIVKRLADGEVEAELLRELQWLLEYPIVIRSDLRSGVRSDPTLNLPRTDCVEVLSAVTEFLIRHSRDFLARGVQADELVFLFHRFIAARSSAWSLARPGVPRVRVDASWGLPDGLSFYPHDSFEVDTGTGRIRRHCRCKYHYLSVDAAGRWIRQNCPPPADWRPSLTDSQLGLIAAASQRLAEQLQQPVQVMFFVDCDPALGYPPCLPWYCTTEAVITLPDQSSVRHAGARLVVEVREDLPRVALRITKHEPVGALRLDLVPDLLRDTDFLKEVGAFARAHALAIELQGSILTHAYYILERTGAAVHCLDEFLPVGPKRGFGKLVRDLVPLRITSGGEVAKVAQVRGEQLARLLRTKAVEEALELFYAKTPDAVFEELADLLEVVLTTCKASGRSLRRLQQLARKKRLERGGFERGWVLVETREVPLLESVGADRAQFAGTEPTESERRLEHTGQFLRRRAPRAVFRRIVVPLVPPDPDQQAQGEFIVHLPDSDLALGISYSEKEITIRRAEVLGPRSDRQLELGLFE